jgi:hypothetical protein
MTVVVPGTSGNCAPRLACVGEVLGSGEALIHGGATEVTNFNVLVPGAVFSGGTTAATNSPLPAPGFCQCCCFCR